MRTRRIVGGRAGRRRSAVFATYGAACGLVAVLLAGCVANPPSAVENPTEAQPATPARTATTVTVAMDGIGRGFNPHLLADQSPTTAAVASLVLPSAFRYQPDPADPAIATLMMDTSVLESAHVVSESPFAVEYQLQNAAQWSDGAPIAVEDFRYLWQRMISEPGVVDPAGYALISDVAASGEGGKTVKVTFDAPYPAWEELFTNLVPAHLVKDSLGGFANALKDKIAVSGGQFKVTTVDRGRNEIVLDRNDRFWGDVATPDRLVFRRGGGSGPVTSSLRVGDTQLTAMRGGGALLAQLSTIPGVQVARELQPRVLALTLNSRDPQLADPRVREGLLGLLDPELLAVIGAHSESAVIAVRAQLLAPSDPDYAETAPARIGGAAALALLTDAGYQMGAGETGKQLSLVIAAPAGDDSGTSVANAVADTWRAAGVDVTVSGSTDSDQIYGAGLLDGSISAIVGWQSVGGDIATGAASRFGCERPPESGTVPTETATPSPTSTEGETASAPDERPPSNLGGVCDPAAQELLDGALSGDPQGTALARELEPRLWGLHSTLPILQDSAVVAIGDTVTGAVARQPIVAGLFVNVGGWARQPE
ncbi:ABC transporter family substrate-binding protein [Tomitella biformata]|uniref:ABC transporter family substrate-binding protein n=1 Tax=Tomitella biformata TaxID=630403 RepID=UPI00046430A2|nr:ABC transporter family substrate-binding protein [Tomitella biformata]